MFIDTAILFYSGWLDGVVCISEVSNFLYAKDDIFILFSTPARRLFTLTVFSRTCESVK
jgi:hypothetical protein